MQMHTGEIGQVLISTRRKSTISVGETTWGYIIGQGVAARRRAGIGELLAVFGCLFFGTVAFGQWLIPDSAYSDGALGLRISGTIMLFVFASLLYLMARRGLSVECHVDTKRDMVRLVRRNREGGTMIWSSFAFSEIGSVFIKRSKSNETVDKMYMRPKSMDTAILVATGASWQLEPLLDRVQRDLRRQMPKVAKVSPRHVEPSRVRNKSATG